LEAVRDDQTCAVCGRSILAGERIHSYLGHKGGARPVCELCRGRAERRGWVAAAESEDEPQDFAEPDPAAEPEPMHEPAQPGPLPGPAEAGSTSGGGGERAEQIDLGPAEADARRDPAAAGATVGRQLEPEVAESPQMRLERAVARFNASEASRTVGGLMRTLGQPWVSIGAAAGSPSQVRITVAWELGWYQWGVDLDAETSEIQELDKGREIGELDGPAQQWNANAAPGGVLQLGAPPQLAASDGDPAH
jgi:hypothetical protein